MRDSLPDAASAGPGDPVVLISRLYRQILGREPDDPGLSHHVQMLQRTGSLADVVTALTESDEFAVRLGASSPVRSATSAVQLPSLTEPITVVDIGAQRLVDQQHAYAPLQDAGFLLSVVGFEPLSDRLEDRRDAEAGSNLELSGNFVGDGTDQIFYINILDNTSSLLPLNKQLTSQFVEIRHLHTVRTEKAKTQRLDDLLKYVPRVDFLKLDIQGFELHALRGAHDLIKRTLVVHCEVSFAEIYEGQCHFSDVEAFLREKGFDLIDLIHAHRGGYVVPSGTIVGDRLLWADAVFFKSLEHVTPDERAVQATIAQHVYKKVGLAERLLSV